MSKAAFAMTSTKELADIAGYGMFWYGIERRSTVMAIRIIVAFLHKRGWARV